MQNKFEVGDRIAEDDYGMGTVILINDDGTMDVQFGQRRHLVRQSECRHLIRDNHSEGAVSDEGQRTATIIAKTGRMVLKMATCDARCFGELVFSRKREMDKGGPLFVHRCNRCKKLFELEDAFPHLVFIMSGGKEHRIREHYFVDQV